MKENFYCLFDTPLGTCGIAWSESDYANASPTVLALQLPEASANKAAARLARRTGARPANAPPHAVSAVIEKISKHLGGKPQDFRDVPLDLSSKPAFSRQVYAAARKIPAGETRTYGEIAKSLGRPAAARAVGQALGRNPIALIIPCHRVLAASGKLGGFSAHGGLATKTKMLALEGVSS